jgi:putative RecB family exonuclease
MVIYSHSRLSTFEQCPLKFKLQYIDKLIPDIKQSIEGFLGNKVHETLEWIYNLVIETQTCPNLDDVLKYFTELWNKDFNHEIKIIKQENNIEHYFNQGIKFLIDYYLKHSPFQDNTIETEKRIFVKLDEQGKYKLQGFVDRIVYNPETNIYEIHDYKTGSFLKSQEELDKDRQLALYSIGIRDNFENVNDVHLVWHFLAFNKKLISRRTEKELEDLKKEIIELIDEIESTKEFNPNPSKLCKWCGFRNNCYLFNSHSDSTFSALETLSPESDDSEE